MGIRTGVAALIAAFALTPGAAAAADRYASPTGTSNPTCGQADPCDIVTAVNGAALDDDVTIEAGTYGSSSAPISTVLQDDSNFITIHGEAGQPAPVIYSDATDAFAFGGGSSLSDVTINDSAPNAFGVDVNGPASALTKLFVHTTGSGAWACYPNGELTDSVCWQSGSGGGGAKTLVVNSANAVLTNDTIEATGFGGWGVAVVGNGPVTMSMNLENTIVYGLNVDVYIGGNASSGGKIIFGANYSDFSTLGNFATTSGTGTVSYTSPGAATNQIGTPRFVNEAAGDFEEAAGSPTIGEGATNAVAGETDLGGLPWASPPDIGAYQFYNAPSCNAVSASTKFGTAVALHLRCSDALTDPVTLAVKSGPAHGKLSAISGGSVTYTPNAGYSGKDSFTYTGTSRLGTSAPATVSVTVAAKPSGGKTPAPHISHAKQSKGVFTFTLNEPATVTLSFGQRGHVRGTLKVAGKAGKNTVHFKGRFGKHHTLKAGAYVVTIVASNSGGRSKSVKVKYKLAARR